MNEKYIKIRQKYWDWDGEKKLPTNYSVIEVYEKPTILEYKVLEKDEFVSKVNIDDTINYFKKKYNIKEENIER